MQFALVTATQKTVGVSFAGVFVPWLSRCWSMQLACAAGVVPRPWLLTNDFLRGPTRVAGKVSSYLMRPGEWIRLVRAEAWAIALLAACRAGVAVVTVN